MKMKLDGRYIALPTRRDAPIRRLRLSRGGESALELDVRFCAEAPDEVYYYDARELPYGDYEASLEPGPEARIACLPAVPEDAALYAEPERPRAHFTPSRGWMNDPNGLVRVGDTYHLFFQYNPVGTDWGNMHWGHAVSSDLTNWREREIALFPDALGTMYSGSAIIDERNVSGLGEGGVAPVLFYYTAAGDPYTQCLAYSLDGGATLKKYAGNPIISHIEATNRDPKVVWVPELGCFVMALYLNEDRYTLLRSDDLLRWERFQDIALAEDWECPDIYPLTLEGQRYWVFSGASARYYVGRFEGGRYAPVQGAKRFGYGCAYAAQTYSNTPGRAIRIAWNRTKTEGARFNCSATTPLEMSLSRLADGSIALSGAPVREFECLRLESGARGAAWDVKLRFAPGARFEAELFGLKLRAEGGTLRVGEEAAMPLSGGEARLIFDAGGVEIYAQGAQMVLAHECDFDKGLVANGCELEAWPLKEMTRRRDDGPAK